MPDVVRQNLVPEEARKRADAWLKKLLDDAERSRVARAAQREAERIARERAAQQAPAPPEVPALPMNTADP